MPTIRIGVINPSETEKVWMEVPDDVPVQELRDAIVESLNLPAHGNDGRRLRYYLDVEVEGETTRLNERDTLHENDINPDDILRLRVEMVAGCSSGE